MIREARLRAFAKLNLGLRVLYRRPDQYHELRTVFQTISLADELQVRFSSARETRITVEGTPEIADNLVERAAQRALEAMGIQADVRFFLKKNIPAGAGLGGGSSDAAAVLLALPVLAGKRLPWDDLSAIAGQLGSDVPFFLHGGTALGVGRGEELYPLPDRRAKFVLLLTPEIHSSTAEAYRGISEKLTLVLLQNKLKSFQQEIWQTAEAAPVNDFEEVVFTRHPDLGRLKQRLERAGAESVLMTGSGSALFGVFPSRARLDRAQRTIEEVRSYRVSFLSRPQYRSAWSRALKQHTKGDLWPPRSRYAR
jgi:4-diphosphocytidyl-2-C-methyl-D-erythritol kinase